MTDEEIRKLAKQFAEYSLSEERKMYDDETFQRLVDESSKGLFDVRYVLQWLSEKFCIVEKEKVKNFLELSEVHALDAIDAVEFIEDVFGKELFNDTEK